MTENNYVNIAKIGVLDTVGGAYDIILLRDKTVLAIDRKYICFYPSYNAFLEGDIKNCKCIKRKGMK